MQLHLPPCLCRRREMLTPNGRESRRVRAELWYPIMPRRTAAREFACVSAEREPEDEEPHAEKSRRYIIKIRTIYICHARRGDYTPRRARFSFSIFVPAFLRGVAAGACESEAICGSSTAHAHATARSGRRSRVCSRRPAWCASRVSSARSRRGRHCSLASHPIGPACLLLASQRPAAR